MARKSTKRGKGGQKVYRGISREKKKETVFGRTRRGHEGEKRKTVDS